MVIDKGDDGVLLKPKRPYQTTCLDDVAGCLAYGGRAKERARNKLDICLFFIPVACVANKAYIESMHRLFAPWQRKKFLRKCPTYFVHAPKTLDDMERAIEDAVLGNSPCG